MRQKKIILFRGFVTILVGRLILKNIPGKRIILTCQAFLIFILLSWIGNCFAQTKVNNLTPSFDELVKKIHAHTLCGFKYNPSRTAAIVNVGCDSAIYINFKTKRTYAIAEHKLPNHIFPTWISDTIATVESSCGTGCVNVIIFLAPARAVACSDYEYRIESLRESEPPDYYHNRPLLIDPKRKIYVCYDNEKNIQVFPFPAQPTIRPPKGYFSEKAEIRDGELVVTYENRYGKTRRIAYGEI